MKKYKFLLTFLVYSIIAIFTSLFFLNPSERIQILKEKSYNSKSAFEGLSEAFYQGATEAGDIIQRLFYYTIAMSILSYLLFIAITLLQNKRIGYWFIFLLFIEITVAFAVCYLSQFFPIVFSFFKNGEHFFILVFISFLVSNIYFYNKYYKPK